MKLVTLYIILAVYCGVMAVISPWWLIRAAYVACVAVWTLNATYQWFMCRLARLHLLYLRSLLAEIKRERDPADWWKDAN